MEKGTGIRKHLPIILIVLMFLLGAGIFLYPNFSNWYYERHQSKIIQEYGEVVEEISSEDLEAEKEAVREFNRSLLENQVVLTDPFDASQLDENLNDYSEYLAQDEVMAYIDIPKIDVYLPIYHGTDKDTLEKGIGHLVNTSLPMGGEGTHCVLSGHTGLPAALLFTNLDKMQKEDQFYVHVLDEILAYEVDLISVVEPDDISTLRIESDKDYVTLVTCTPYGQNTHRLLVRGHRIPYVEEEVKQEQEQRGARSFWDRLVDFWKHRSLPLWVMIVVVASVILCVLLISPLSFGKKKEKDEEENEEQKEKKRRAVSEKRKKRKEAAAARKREESKERENLDELERLRKLKRLQELENLRKLEQPKKEKRSPEREKIAKEKVKEQKRKRQSEKQQQRLARKERIDHRKEKLLNEKKQRQLGREERVNRQKEKLLNEKKLRQLSSKERINRQKEKIYEEKKQRERIRRRRLGRAYAKRRRRRRR